MSKRINKVFEKYVKNFRNKHYEDISDIYDWSDREDITKEQLEACLERKINLFVKQLYPELSTINISEEKKFALCAYIKETLKENIYNNNPSVFSFFDYLLCVPEEAGYYDLFPHFNISFGETFGFYGCCFVSEEEWFRSLIIEVCYGQHDYAQVFQLRCSYAQSEGQYNIDFEKYINNSEDFLTNQDLIKYLGSEDDDYFDYFQLDIVKLANPVSLLKPLLNKNIVKKMKEDVREILE